ncbi:MAG: hypothetical protein JEY71_14325 [Sphaerochaeta sp.]|nr:hypothetical protein [Sphaerochaeta sp.]
MLVLLSLRWGMNQGSYVNGASKRHTYLQGIRRGKCLFPLPKKENPPSADTTQQENRNPAQAHSHVTLHHLQLHPYNTPAFHSSSFIAGLFLYRGSRASTHPLATAVPPN